jgi:hypothetical protein
VSPAGAAVEVASGGVVGVWVWADAVAVAQSDTPLATAANRTRPCCRRGVRREPATRAGGGRFTIMIGPEEGDYNVLR